MARLNKLLTGHTITDEPLFRTDSTALPLGHDTIRVIADVEIWTGLGKTGTQLTLTTDYTVTVEDTDLSAEAGVAVYTKLAIVNGAYQGIQLYANYKTCGDYASAESIRAASGLLGELKDYPYKVLPDENWGWADGAALLRASYPLYYEVACPRLGVITVTIASPGVLTLADHGLATGDQVFLETTGALPTGLVANTLYFVIYVNTSTFRLATTRANAKAGTAINTSGTQSGVHTIRDSPHGISAATDFLKPDRRESSPYGAGTRAAGVTAHDALVRGEFADDQAQTVGTAGYYICSGSVGTEGYIMGSTSSGRVSRSGEITSGQATRNGTVTRGKIVGTNYIVRIQ